MTSMTTTDLQTSIERTKEQIYQIKQQIEEVTDPQENTGWNAGLKNCNIFNSGTWISWGERYKLTRRGRVLPFWGIFYFISSGWPTHYVIDNSVSQGCLNELK